MTEHLKVVRKHKDTVFRMLFQDKKELLKMYNALNDTSYADPEDLEVYTLENAIYMNVKNDVSFLLDSMLNLYEQQSSFNPNMPLRDLIYIARQLEKYVRDKSVYSSKLIRIPAPKFIVFYNGIQKQPEDRILKLSDAYLKETGEPELELKVRMLNINPECNKELMRKCRTLREYSLYVDRVREHTKKLPVEEAVRTAVDECIEEGILADFLLKQKAEVIAMSIFEYNEESELKKIREDEYSLGKEAGMAEGHKAGLTEGLTEGHKAGLAEGRELEMIDRICKKLKKGKTAEEIADDLDEELSVILSVVRIATAHAPDYEPESVYEEWKAKRADGAERMKTMEEEN